MSSRSDEDAPGGATHATGTRNGRMARVLEEIRAHSVGYSVLGAFMLAGPVLAPFVFPEAPLGAAVLGGLAFGVIATLCAVGDRLL
jgi:hypothetical protein